MVRGPHDYYSRLVWCAYQRYAHRAGVLLPYPSWFRLVRTGLRGQVIWARAVRSSGENTASAGLGKRLGFVPLGAQIAIDLEV